MTNLCGLLDVEPLGQQVGHFDEAHQVVHITLDASGYSGVLDLHGKAPAIMQVAPMHLHPQRTVITITTTITPPIITIMNMIIVIMMMMMLIMIETRASQG